MPPDCAWPGSTGVNCPVDIPANAESKGNRCPRVAEEVPKRLRLYPAPIPWTRTVEL